MCLRPTLCIMSSQSIICKRLEWYDGAGARWRSRPRSRVMGGVSRMPTHSLESSRHDNKETLNFSFRHRQHYYFGHFRSLCHIDTGLRNDDVIWFQCASSVPLTWEPRTTWPTEVTLPSPCCSATVTLNWTAWKYRQKKWKSKHKYSKVLCLVSLWTWRTVKNINRRLLKGPSKIFMFLKPPTVN